MDFHLKKTFNRGEGMIFAIPQTNHYQKISNLKINFSPNITHLDEWGNEVIILNDVKNFSLKFTYQGKIIKKDEKKLQSLSIEDYRKINKNILSFYTQSNGFIHPNHPKIYSLAKKIVGNEKNLLKITRKLYQFILDYLIYEKPIDGLYSDLYALEKKRVDCGGFSSLYISLLNSLNIPAQLVVGYLIKTNLLKGILNRLHFLNFGFSNLWMHAWPEILLPDNSWFPTDPSIEWRRIHGLSRRLDGFGIISSKRLVISYGSDLEYKIGRKKYQVDIIQKPVIIN